jgi:hypothetical protein
MDGIEEKLQKFAKQDDEKAEFIQVTKPSDCGSLWSIDKL